MLGVLGRDQNCPVARALDVLGEKWSLLILRDALGGATRFSEFAASLGTPRDVLATRLQTLVTCGLLERRTYQPVGGRRRDEYVLTETGRSVEPVLRSLAAWGLEHTDNRG